MESENGEEKSVETQTPSVESSNSMKVDDTFEDCISDGKSMTASASSEVRDKEEQEKANSLTIEEGEPVPKKLKLTETNLCTSSGASSHSLSGEANYESWEDRRAIKARLKQKQELLDQLQKVEFYKSKWSIDELEILTVRWRELAVTTFEDLFEKTKLEKESLTKKELLDHLGVDPNLIGLDLSKENTQELE